MVLDGVEPAVAVTVGRDVHVVGEHRGGAAAQVDLGGVVGAAPLGGRGDHAVLEVLEQALDLARPGEVHLQRLGDHAAQPPRVLVRADLAVLAGEVAQPGAGALGVLVQVVDHAAGEVDQAVRVDHDRPAAGVSSGPSSGTRPGRFCRTTSPNRSTATLRRSRLRTGPRAHGPAARVRLPRYVGGAGSRRPAVHRDPGDGRGITPGAGGTTPSRRPRAARRGRRARRRAPRARRPPGPSAPSASRGRARGRRARRRGRRPRPPSRRPTPRARVPPAPSSPSTAAAAAHTPAPTSSAVFGVRWRTVRDSSAMPTASRPVSATVPGDREPPRLREQHERDAARGRGGGADHDHARVQEGAAAHGAADVVVAQPGAAAPPVAVVRGPGGDRQPVELEQDVVGDVDHGAGHQPDDREHQRAEQRPADGGGRPGEQHRPEHQRRDDARPHQHEQRLVAAVAAGAGERGEHREGEGAGGQREQSLPRRPAGLQQRGRPGADTAPVTRTTSARSPPPASRTAAAQASSSARHQARRPAGSAEASTSSAIAPTTTAPTVTTQGARPVSGTAATARRGRSAAGPAARAGGGDDEQVAVADALVADGQVGVEHQAGAGEDGGGVAAGVAEDGVDDRDDEVAGEQVGGDDEVVASGGALQGDPQRARDGGDRGDGRGRARRGRPSVRHAPHHPSPSSCAARCRPLCAGAPGRRRVGPIIRQTGRPTPDPSTTGCTSRGSARPSATGPTGGTTPVVTTLRRGPRLEAPRVPQGDLVLQPPPETEPNEGASNVLMQALPMLGSLGSIGFVASTGGGRGWCRPACSSSPRSASSS